MPLVGCKQCAKKFYAKPSWLRQGNGKYCSLECYRKSKQSGKEVACDTCGTLVYKNQADLQRSKSHKFFCSKSCQTHWRNQLYTGERHKNFTTGASAYRSILARTNVSRRCRLCRTEDARVLAVHHVDKNRRNNDPKNLAWLCHNCHFLVHHHKGEWAKFMATMV